MTEKIRVLHCIETIASGGVEQTILTLIRGLDKTRFQHHIICTWKGGPVAEALENEGVYVTAIGPFKNPFEWKKLQKVVRIARAYQPHIIHGAVFEGMTMATVAGLFFRKSKVILEETSDPQNRSNKANLLLRAFSLRASVFQAISEEVGEFLVRETGVNPVKVLVIPNGVPEPKNVSEREILSLKNILGITEEDFCVGYVGRLFNDHKRVTDLVEAISLIPDPNIKLLIVGDGKDKELVLSRVNELNLEGRVIFLGYLPDPAISYSIMKILCVPSSREGFGLVAVEAMLKEIPVIASNVGGLKDIVKEGETGFLIPPFDPNAIASKILQLAGDTELRESMGKKGRIRALENYTAERYCKEVESLYLELLCIRGIEFG